jgi:hypothetical protein
MLQERLDFVGVQILNMELTEISYHADIAASLL